MDILYTLFVVVLAGVAIWKIAKWADGKTED